jgi:Secretion system C-terminal sorting domain
MIIKLLLFTVIFSCGIIYSQSLPFDRSTLFAGSGLCEGCHSAEEGDTVMIHNGVDVSPISYWRSTMMGNASKDPFWRAAVAEEVHRFPQLQEVIETTCLRCHSPMGYTEAIYNGQTYYSMNELRQDPLANDGVSCTLCHQINPGNFGSQDSYSGHYTIPPDSILYGPYANSDTTYMPFVVGYYVQQGPHLDHPELCATCHTLFTPYLDNQGNIAGDFPEQTAYLEWKNSIYPSQDVKCQTCHMPIITDPIKIAAYGEFPRRSPFWRHTFVGGNTYMLRMLRDNIDSLNVTAYPEHFDSTIARAEELVSEKALNLSTNSYFQNDSLYVNVKIENLAGHKLPTGIPFRRMWVHFKVQQAGGGVIFESGNWDNEGKISGYNSDYEPHYQNINSEDEVQVYEGVFADVDGNVTHTLLRAAQFLKDNRIPPKGFTTSHISYTDSTEIYGNALTDPDFNKDGGLEGTGSDIITYTISAQPGTSYNILVEICFQTIKPEAVDSIRSINEPDIVQFAGMYDALPNIPSIIKSETTGIVTGIENQTTVPATFYLSQNYPNPFNPVTIISYQIPNNNFVSLKIYNALGSEVATLVNQEKPAGNYKVEFNAADLASGIYYYKLSAGSFSEVKKMVLIK